MKGDSKAVFLKDTPNQLTLLEFVSKLENAKKVVLRFKDGCHQDGLSWIFGKFSDITRELKLEKFLRPLLFFLLMSEVNENLSDPPSYHQFILPVGYWGQIASSNADF